MKTATAAGVISKPPCEVHGLVLSRRRRLLLTDVISDEIRSLSFGEPRRIFFCSSIRHVAGARALEVADRTERRT